MATKNGVFYSNISGINLRTNTTTRLSIANNGSIQFNEDYSFPTSDGSANTVLLTNGSGALSFSTIPNASLDNSSITINGASVSLGGSINVGDITEVTAGNGLTGGGSTGSVTLNVGAGTGISVAADTVGLDTSNTRNVDHSSVSISAGSGLSGGGTIASNRTISMDYAGTDNYILASGAGTGDILTSWHIPVSNSSNNVLYYDVLALPFSNNSGTVTSVAISGTDGIDVDSGSPITSSGTITLGLSNVPNSSLANSSITIAGSTISLGGSISGDSIIADVGAGEITNAQLENSSITINGSAVALGGTVNVGDITAVVAGDGLTGGGTTGSVTLNIGAGTLIDVAADTVSVDLSELTTSTSDADGDFFVVVDSANAQKKLTKANINISGFNNDAGFTTNTGTVTSVAISGTDGIDVDSGSPITGAGTITLGLSSVPNSSLANSSITIAGSTVSLGGAISGDSIIADVGAGEITNAQLENNSITINGSATALGGSINVGDITNVSAGNGLTGGGTTGSVTLNVGAGTGISVAADTVGLDYLGTDNFIDSATNLEGTGIALGDTIIYHDATDNNVKKGLVSDLPYTNSSGSVTSVAISGSDGIDVDSGSPITTSGTIALGLSNVPNSSLANSSITVTGGNGLTGGGSASLGSSISLNVGAGTLIDVDGSNVNVDLSELTTSTSNGDGDFFVVVDSSNNQKKLTKGNISNSGFSNDAGYITSAGNTNIYSIDGTLSSLRTIIQGSNNLDFASSDNESLNIFKSISTPLNIPRVFIEADDVYSDVLSLLSSAPTVAIVTAYDSNQAPVFRVDGQGNLTATSKAFDIPHPDNEKKAQGMRLKHGNLEGPEHGVYIRGRQLNDKEIELPEYWLDLVDSDTITVQLTSIGSHQNLYVKKIENNVVHIGNGNLFSNKIDCYYFIQAERKDIDKIEVEYTTK